MSVTRTQAATFLNNRMSNLVNEVSQSATDDSASGFGPDIDAALRRLGKAESSLATATVEDSERNAFFALCRYYALERFAELLATKVDVGAPVEEGSRDEVFLNIRDLMDRAAAQAAGLGYPVDETPSWSLGDLNLDYVEPDPE